MSKDSQRMTSPSDLIRMRNFAPGDEEEVVKLWNKVVESGKDYSPLTVEGFRNRVINNPNFDPKAAFLACLGETLVGFCLVTIRRELFKARSLEEFPAFLSAIMVHLEYRRRKIGSRLISEATDYLRSQGKKEIRTGYHNPISLFVGIDVNKEGILNFFSRQGFDEDREIRMNLSPLRTFEKEKEIGELQERLTQASVSVLALEEQDMQGLLEMLKEEAIGWYEPMAKDVESGELDMKNIFIAKKEGRIIGFVRVGGSGDSGGVWGILTRPEERSKGIGTLLLFSALNKIEKDGVKNVGLTTGSDNFPAQRIYKKAGFREVGTFAMLGRKI